MLAGRQLRSLLGAAFFLTLLCTSLAGHANAADAPRVEITSRVPNEGTTHVIGFLEGTNLTSAGIFDHGEKLKDINVAGTPGSQRVNFDFAIEGASPTMTIEVTDASGQSASAQVMTASAGVSSTEAAMPPVPEAESEPGALPPVAPGSSGNAIEIPRYGGSGALSSGEHRRFPGGVGAPMANAGIDVMSVLPVLSHPGSYEVTGQITGMVRRAGVYVNGRPAHPIPLTSGAISPFDVVFPLTGGRSATIRAYGAGSNYIEVQLNLNAPNTIYSNPYGRPSFPGFANPYGASR